MNEYTFRVLANKALADKPFPETMFPPSPYYRFLMHLAAELHPSLSIELGVCGGGGSLHLCRGYSGGRVVGIDNADDHPDNIRYIRQNFMNFHYWLGDSVLAAKEIHRLYGDVGILFVDTTHTYEQTMMEYEAWRPYLASKAVVCFDDLFRPGMDKAWAELPSPKLRLDELHTGAENGGGFGVIWTA
jgi:cephalosporin hydroxylase